MQMPARGSDPGMAEPWEGRWYLAPSPLGKASSPGTACIPGQHPPPPPPNADWVHLQHLLGSASAPAPTRSPGTQQWPCSHPVGRRPDGGGDLRSGHGVSRFRGPALLIGKISVGGWMEGGCWAQAVTGQRTGHGGRASKPFTKHTRTLPTSCEGRRVPVPHPGSGVCKPRLATSGADRSSPWVSSSPAVNVPLAVQAGAPGLSLFL